MLHRFNVARGFDTPDGSRITELLGRVASDDSSVSVARITMPVGRGQPRRQNAFRELMVIIHGSCEIDLPTGTVQLGAGDVLDLPANTPYAERGGSNGCTCWAICWPAFAPDLVTWLAD